MELPYRLLRALRGEQRPPPPSVVEIPKRPLVLLQDLWELYQAEEGARPVDPALLAGEDGSRCFGERQPNIPLSHRQSILQWMCDASLSVGWSYATLHTAICIFDTYVLSFNDPPPATARVDHDDAGELLAPLSGGIAAEDLPSLSASCLYLGACLRECMIDQTVIGIEEFQRICPEIGSAYVVRAQQLRLLSRDALGRTLGNRTPYDIAQLFLQRLAFFRVTLPLYTHLVSAGALDHCLDTLMQVSTVCMLNAVSLCLPCSSWIACTLIFLVQLIHPFTATLFTIKPLADILPCLCDSVMEYPGGYPALKRLLTLYRPVIRFTIQGINRSAGARVRARPASPPKPHVFKMPAGLSKTAVCSYRAPVVLQLRRNILPTLREIQAIGRDGTLLSVVREHRTPFERSVTTLDQENVYLGSKLRETEPRRTVSNHVRRHTSICKCVQCTRYQENPPDWYASAAITTPPLSSSRRACFQQRIVSSGGALSRTIEAN